MTKQLLIYERAVPLSSEVHRNLSVDVGADYSFAQGVNSTPVVAIEFPSAVAEYTIVFTANEKDALPILVLGVRDAENLYFKDGQWKAKYIPAFIRRYPFVFASGDEGKNFTLCIDEGFSGLNREDKGQRLFDDQGQRTPYLDNALNFLKDYQGQYLRTQAFCRKLKELDLLEPMRAQVKGPQGQEINLGGFAAVSRDKLKKLSGDQLAELARTDELELIYLHLASLRNFPGLVERMAEASAA